MKIMGLDIGGANTDCCIYDISKDACKLVKSKKVYLPMWSRKEELEACLEEFKEEMLDVVVVTTTAELSDGYTSKEEGINDISCKVMNVFKDSKVYFVTFKGLKSYEYVKKNPLDMAAANWIATSNLVAKIKDECIFMDMGTTTTDIIPIRNSHETASGHSDLERLCSGELVYTGMLRTNIATFVDKVPVREEHANVSSELFTITADVYRILGYITEEEYTCDSPDNRKKDVTSCKRRLLRLICAQLEDFNDEEVLEIAHFVEDKQIEEISQNLHKIVTATGIQDIVITNYAKAPICKTAAEKLGLNTILLDDYFTNDTLNISPTVGAVQMYLNEKYSDEEDVSLIPNEK